MANEIQKILIKAVEMPNIIHSRRANTQSFEFKVLCACADVFLINILHSRAHKLTCFPGRRDARCQETNFAQSHPILSLISLSFHNWYLIILCLFTHQILTIASETWRVLVAVAVGLLIAQSDVRDPPPAASWTSPANRISETQWWSAMSNKILHQASKRQSTLCRW
jgi:hypothetical protein